MHKRVATTNRIGDGLKSSWSAGFVEATVPTLSGTSLRTVMGIVSILLVMLIRECRKCARYVLDHVAYCYCQLVQKADDTSTVDEYRVQYSPVILCFRGTWESW